MFACLFEELSSAASIAELGHLGGKKWFAAGKA
jgi:hypothetical protein